MLTLNKMHCCFQASVHMCKLFGAESCHSEGCHSKDIILNQTLSKVPRVLSMLLSNATMNGCVVGANENMKND